MKELPKSERPYEKLELYGEKTLLKYSEWEFNNNNMIFIF